MEIKGTKEGILITLQDQDWQKARNSLIEKIEDKAEFFKGAQLVLDVGNHELHTKELGELRDMLSAKDILLLGVLSPSTVTQETAQLLGLITEFPKPKETQATMLDPLDTVLAGEPAQRADHAKERLHLVLIHDRTDLSPEDLKTLKDRLIQVIAEYVEIDAAETEIQIVVDGWEQSLIANIPLKSPRLRR